MFVLLDQWDWVYFLKSKTMSAFLSPYHTLIKSKNLVKYQILQFDPVCDGGGTGHQVISIVGSEVSHLSANSTVTSWISNQLLAPLEL